MHIGLNKPETNLNSKDVDGASPNCVKFKSIRNSGSPLNPQYNLSKVEQRPITPPKFIRDHMDVNDIEGARPTKVKVIEKAMRETMKIDDIGGTTSKVLHKPRARSPGYNNYDYSDITKAQFVSQRVVNPLNPTYKARDENGNVIDIGEVEGSKPMGLPKQHDTANKPFTLRTDDIHGAQASTKGLGAFHETNTRKEFRQTNRNDDIPGAQAGSLKKSPQTKRNTNPLNPSYEDPGHKDLGSTQNDMFGGTKAQT